jgi:hypothetical protein
LRARFWAALGLAALCAASPSALAAQLGGPILQQPGGGRWLPSLGIRGGWDYRNSDPSLGAVVRFPIPIPVVPLTVSPGADLVFHDNLTDRQGMVDLTADIFGLALGGGPIWLNTVFEDDLEAPRETQQGWTALAGFRNRSGQFGLDLDFRWVFVDGIEQPRYLMLAIVWNPGAPRRRGFGG